jgi:hypothetical protein
VDVADELTGTRSRRSFADQECRALFTWWHTVIMSPPRRLAASPKCMRTANASVTRTPTSTWQIGSKWLSVINALAVGPVPGGSPYQ